MFAQFINLHFFFMPLDWTPKLHLLKRCDPAKGGVLCSCVPFTPASLLPGQTKQQKRFTWFGKLTQNAMGLLEKTPQVSLAVLGKYGKLCEPLLVLMTEMEWFGCLNKILTLPCFCELISNRKSNCTLKSVQGCFQHAFSWFPHEELDKARN